jgi:DNA-binding beta-propeller fold protein YncE
MSKERQTMAPSSRRIRATITPAALAAAFLILGAGASRSAQIDLLVADDASSLYRYDGFTGAFVANVFSGLNCNAHCMTYGPGGYLYLLTGDQVLRLDGASGNVLGTFVANGAGGIVLANSLAFGPDGNLYVTDPIQHAVLRFNGATGAFVDAFVKSPAGGLQQPVGLTFGRDGRLYVSDTGTDSVRRYDGKTGAFVDTFVRKGKGGMNNPWDLTFGPDGNLYVADDLGNQVLRFDGATSAFLGAFVPAGAGVQRSRSVIFGPDGLLYVTSLSDNAVYRFDGGTGAFVDKFVPSGSGGLNTPNGMAFTPCGGGDRALCLGSGRFTVEAEYRTSTGQSGFGHAMSITDDTGYFWFFNPANVEVVTKVLSACGLNQRIWSFSAGLTDVQVTLIVRDSRTGEVRRYSNPQGTAFTPIQDTDALAGCFAGAQASAGAPAAGAVEEPAAGTQVETSGRTSIEAAALPSCSGLCLSGNRFKVSATWTTPDGKSGVGIPAALTGDTGYFWFFNPANVEAVVKVVDGCGLNNRFWVFAGGLTNVKVALTVTDTKTGMFKTYSNAQGIAFQPIQDTAAFATCP